MDDHALFAETMQLALLRHGYDALVQSLPEDGSMATLRATVLGSRAHTVLLDLDLGPFGDGIDLVAPLAQSGANVVVVTASGDQGRWGACARLGARKVVSKKQPLRQILSIVRRLEQGLSVMNSGELERLLGAGRHARLSTDDARRRLDLLSPRERQVLGALIEGRHVHEIARNDVVSEATVRGQVKAIREKLEVTSQLEAVGLANSVGWRSS
ncbi:LuxR C-terminal-related transcriptional regulator [Nocardioides currus]|uniref:LuxR C-terminal-related transcriptional regulator n=1 Tax=Nocardioides currus TaxID=2133958 RepID=UPI001FAFF3EE|nr:LuxR C-terminal-related transcriptional regulator [Nocardioides currus]